MCSTGWRRPASTRAVVNVHHLADQIERHLAGRKTPQIVISDERAELLGTAGGPVKAMPQLGGGPFFLVNSDTIWIDGVMPNLKRLAASFDAARMDALLLMAPTATATGYSGRGDFSMAADGRLKRRGERDVVPFVYAGAAILTPAFFAGVGAGTVVDDAAVRPRRRSRPAARAAARRHLDACRHARRRGRGRGRADRERGVDFIVVQPRSAYPVRCDHRVRERTDCIELIPLRGNEHGVSA